VENAGKLVRWTDRRDTALLYIARIVLIIELHNAEATTLYNHALRQVAYLFNKVILCV